MPVDAGIINPGDDPLSGGDFTYDAINGTPPYTFEIQVDVGDSGIVANVAGDPPVVTFDTIGAIAGRSYVLTLRGKVTDSATPPPPDVDENDFDDIDYVFVEVAPIVASWDVAPTWSPADIEQNGTTATSATITVASGGRSPYTYGFRWQGTTPPAPGISIVQAGGPTDNVIEISSSPTTPAGSYTGVIEAIITDTNGAVIVVPLNVSFAVLGLRGFTFNPAPMTGTLRINDGDPSTSLSPVSSVVPGSGGTPPFTYLFYWATPPADPNIELVAGAASVQVRALDTANLGLVTGVIRGRATDDNGQQFEFDLNVNLTVTEEAGNAPFDDLIAGLLPVVDWHFNEPNVPILNNAAGATAGDLANAIGTPEYQELGGDLVGTVGAGKLAVGLRGNTTTEGFYMDDTEIASLLNVTEGAIIIIARYTGDYVSGEGIELTALINGEDATKNNDRINVRFQELSEGRIRYALNNTISDIDHVLRTEANYAAEQGYHLIIINQPGDGTGPVMYVNRRQDNAQERTIDAGEEDKWFATEVAGWVNFTVGYVAEDGNDGSVPDAASPGAADVDIDRIVITTVPVSGLDQVKQLYDAYFGTPDALYADGKSIEQSNGNQRVMKYFSQDADGSQLQGGLEQNDSLFTSQIWSHTRLSRDGQFLGVALSSSGDRVETAKWNPSLEKFERLPNSVWSNFKTAVDFDITDPDNLLCLGIGESANRSQIARWNGSSFVITGNQINGFNVQHATNLFGGRFYRGGQNIVVCGNLTGGLRARTYDRTDWDDWTYDALGIDVQPDQNLQRGGLDVNEVSQHVAMCGGTIATTRVYIYTWDSNGDLTQETTVDPFGTRQIATWVGLVFEANGRYLYVFANDSIDGSFSAAMRCYDTQNAYAEVTLTGWSDNNDMDATDIVASPDGKYLMLIGANTISNNNKLYRIVAGGDIEYVKDIVPFSSLTGSGAYTGDFSETYFSDETTTQWLALVNSLGPTFWYRFNQSAAPISNIGSAGSLADLTERNDGSGVFNGTYQVTSIGDTVGETLGIGAVQGGATPTGELQQQGVDYTGSFGTIFMLVDPAATPLSPYIYGCARSFDVDAVFGRFVGGAPAGFVRFRHDVQNASTGDSARRAEVNIAENGFVSICVRKNDDANFPEIFINGVVAPSYDDQVGTCPVDRWFGDFNADRQSFFSRTNVSSGQHFAGKLDEWMYFPDEALSDETILELHNKAFGLV